MHHRTSIVIVAFMLGLGWSAWPSGAPAAEDSTVKAPALAFPSIEGHGGVARFPDAADQPRAGAKICVDLTASGAPEAVHPALDKVARFVNIYAGAGARPAEARITVILHGKATLIALGDAAYAARFGVKGNPNRPLFAKLKAAGVELLVCGQALTHIGARPGEVASEVGVAVSALTVNVHRQQDGYAYIPLH